MSTVETAGTLADWLRGQPDDALADLLHARPDLLHPVAPDVSALAMRAASRASAEIALDRLNLGALQVVEAFALLPEPASATDIAQVLGVDVVRVEPAIASLRRAAIVWGPDDELRLLAVVRDLIPFPASLGPPARLALTEIAPARLPALLADLSALLGRPLTAPDEHPTAAQALATIAGLFEARQQLSTLLDAVPPKPREVIDLLAAGPPVGRTGGARQPVEAATAETPLRWLLAHGLLVPLDDYTVVLPRELGLLARGDRPFPELALEPPPLPVVEHRVADVDATAAGQAFTVVRLVESLLERWGIDAPGVLRAGGLGVRELRRAARELDIDERFAALLVEVAHAAGLLAPDGEGGEQWLPTLGPAGYDGWLARPAAARWCVLASAWLSTTRVPALVGRREPSQFAGVGERSPSAPNALGPDVDRALAPIVRRDVLRLLASTAAGAAPDGEAADAVLRWSSPRRGGRLRDELTAWSREEAELLGFTGRRAMSSFGRLLAASVLELDGDSRDSRDSGDWRDSTDSPGSGDAASAAADALEPLLPQPLDHVLLQADLTAVAPGPLESELARELSLVADVESTGGATVFRFSGSSIRRALDAGRGAADIHALLAAKSRTPVPQPLSYLVDDVARRHGRMRIGVAASYIRCDDEVVLSEVLVDRRADSLRLHRLAPTVVTSPLAPERVAERLRELGYAPAAEAPDGGLLLRRPDARRAPARRQAPRRRPEFAMPPPSVVGVAVRAIRGGDKAATAARHKLVGTSRSDVLPHSASSETLAVLHDAAATGRPLWIGYLNAQGQASNRIVEPLRVAGGYLTAFDHRRAEVRTFAVHRITGVASLDEAEDGEGSAAVDRKHVDGVDGEPVDGEPVDGEQADGEQADGEQADGEQADGEQADGEPVDGAVASDAGLG